MATENGVKPAATATALPDADPHGVSSGSAHVVVRSRECAECLHYALGMSHLAALLLEHKAIVSGIGF